MNAVISGNDLTMTATASSSMHVRSLTFSGILHLCVILVLTFGVPWQSKRDIVIPPAITVEIVEVAKKTRTNKPTPAVKKPKPPAKKRPPKVAQNTSSVAKSPPRKKPPVPKPEKTKPIPKKEIAPVAAATSKPIVKPPPRKKPPKEIVKKDPTKDFGSVLRNLADTKKTDQLKKVESKVKENIKSVQAPLAPKVTISELDAFRQQLESCWNVPIGAKGIDDINIAIKMVINPDRTLQKAEIVDQGRYRRDSFFRAIADSALRAVYNPRCSPFALPKDKYRAWSVTTVNFNPRDMF